MPDRPWRTGSGVVAVTIWSGLVGLPLVQFHILYRSFTFGEHLHAAILFVASQGLVYWLAARPRPSQHLIQPPSSSLLSGPRVGDRPNCKVAAEDVAAEDIDT